MDCVLFGFRSNSLVPARLSLWTRRTQSRPFNSIEQADNFHEVRAHNVDAQESHNKKQDKHRWKGNLQGKHDHESVSPDERHGVISKN